MLLGQFIWLYTCWIDSGRNGRFNLATRVERSVEILSFCAMNLALNILLFFIIMLDNLVATIL
jgi:hypothetical protein